MAPVATMRGPPTVPFYRGLFGVQGSIGDYLGFRVL